MDDRKLALLLVGIVAILLMGMNLVEYVYYLYHPKLEITCQNNWSVNLPKLDSPIVHNNIQASHSYDERISNRDTLACVKADEYGELWGNSMNPTFFEGNTVLTKNYNENVTLHTGDMIRFFRFSAQYPNCTVMSEAIANNSLGGSYLDDSPMAVIHRIGAIYDDRVVAQGDNLNELETIHRCQITDVVIGIIFT